jgi:hypothetical protein
LPKRIRPGLPAHTPEAKFIEEHISEGGKAIYKEIQAKYRIWCERNGFTPVDTGLSKEIQFRMGVELKRIKIGGKKYHGFQGISVN